MRDSAGSFIGYVGCETYDDASAGLSMVVAPEARGRGFARRMLGVLDRQPELAHVKRLVGGVEPDNLPAQRALQAADFRVAEELDHEGLLAVDKLLGAYPTKR